MSALLVAAHLAAVLLSAGLLFWMEPMFARMLLPRMGGSPSVWNTALVFYQLVLLAGYGYVHWSTTRLARGRQAVLHLVLVLAAFALLPIAVPAGWRPPDGANPVPALLGLMAAALGLPFFVISTTGPLLQRWFSRTDHRMAADPYFLYAASNAGSMAGLLGYPLLLEPRLALAAQTRLWSLGYLLLFALLGLCALLARRRAAPEPSPAASAEPRGGAGADAVTGRMRRLRWLLLAFAPSSLMMGATTHITTDIAAVPLLWVAPLALYLLSFILAFARRPPVPHGLWVRLLPLLVLSLLIVIVGRAGHPVLVIVGLHCAVLFVASMVCHGELALDRPPAERLTEFYLWLALGGALGGVFNALVAPVVFDAVLEYPLAIVLACLLAPSRAPAGAGPRQRALDLLLPLGVAAFCVATLLVCRATGIEGQRLLVVLVVAALAFPIYSFSRRPLRFGLAVGAVLLANPIDVAQGTQSLHAERSFFGMHRVLEDPVRGMRSLYHGTTLHGLQRVRPRACGDPLGYYGRRGPLGDVFRALGPGLRSVGVAGLGTGAIAAHAGPGQRWTFFEIDPAVQRIASDPRYFCYLESAPADVRVVLGDARLSLAATAERFDLLVLDAYSSDAIPVHLLTREALALYRDRLTERGVMVFHVSNQYFDLAPVVGRLAADAGMLCRVRNSGRPSASDLAEGQLPSSYAVVARRPEDLGALHGDPEWKEPPVDVRGPLWTDDYSSLFSVLRTR